MMKSLCFALALAQVGLVQAGLRFGCSSLSIQRIDPVVEPGNIPSAHVHQIVGGNAFNATMTGDVGARGTCTTCEMSEDFSNYWTAVLYFKHPTNGSYKRVPILNNAALAAGTTGGMTIYYTEFDLGRDNIAQQPIKAFQPGFRMTVGSPTSTSSPHMGLTYNCLNTLLDRGPELTDLPAKQCKAGIFVTHHFPACWDGKNLDSPNHQDHMYNTVTTIGFQNAGKCPTTHPVRMPQLVYETVWDTTKFASQFPATGVNPFVWSYEGSHTGWGTHADYMFGWKGDSLQKAMNKSECFYDGCGTITKQQMTTANKCTVKDFVGENTGGDDWLPYLPGRGPMIKK